VTGHAGVIAPVIGGVISLLIWSHKRATEQKDTLYSNLSRIENKVVGLSVTAKNNCELLKEQHNWMQAMDRKINVMDKRLWDISDRRDR